MNPPFQSREFLIDYLYSHLQEAGIKMDKSKIEIKLLPVYHKLRRAIYNNFKVILKDNNKNKDYPLSDIENAVKRFKPSESGSEWVAERA